MQRIRKMLDYKYLTRVQINGFDNYKVNIDNAIVPRYIGTQTYS